MLQVSLEKRFETCAYIIKKRQKSSEQSIHSKRVFVILAPAASQLRYRHLRRGGWVWPRQGELRQPNPYNSVCCTNIFYSHHNVLHIIHCIKEKDG